MIDDEDSYEELTVTCMIGYALANALKMNILSNEYMEILENAWNFVDSRIEDSGIVHDSCTGTGSLSSIEDYLNRKAENGSQRGITIRSRTWKRSGSRCASGT